MPGDGSGISVIISYDGQYHVASCERWGPDGRWAARHVFGPEPSLGEVAGYVNSRAFLDLKYLPVTDETPGPLAGNPKRRQREAARIARMPASSTRSQAALQAALEERKEERRAAARRRRRDEAEERWRQRVEKRRRKRRGH